MKVVMILAGLTGGFFIEWKAMCLTEAVMAKALRSSVRVDKKIFALIAAKNLMVLLVLTLAAVWSAMFLVSFSIGMVLGIFFYVIKKNRHIGKTTKGKGSDEVWKE